VRSGLTKRIETDGARPLPKHATTPSAFTASRSRRDQVPLNPFLHN
jgi:hypothetical protein